MGSPPEIVEDIHGLVQVYGDGSIFRQTNINLNIPIHEDTSVIWKDFLFHSKNNLRLRVYKPHVSSPSQKLPVFYFFHGGGFCLGSCTWPNNHNACQRLSSGLQAIVVAPDYRLAPEHRLPAAMDDALASLEWLQNRCFLECKWLLDEEIDFDRVYIVGDSSGGNMAHHLAVQLGPGSPALAPVRVRGYVLMAPFFGGTMRTKSEAEGEPEPLLTLDLLDRFWRLALPVGKNADHPLSNPFGQYSRSLESVMVEPMLVIAGSKELLKDRVKNYSNKLEQQGKKVHYIEFEGLHHGFFLNEPYSEIGNKVLQDIQHFTSKYTT